MDPENMEMLYEKHRDRTYQEAKNNSVNEYIVEEMVQEAFLKLYYEWSDIPVEAVGKWLSVTVDHMIIDYARHYYREDLVSDSRLECGIEKSARNLGESPEEVLLRELKDMKYRDFVQEVWEGLYSHNQRWFQVLWLTYVQKKSRKEVAKAMHLSENSVRGLLYRAKQWIGCNYGQDYLRLRNGQWRDDVSRLNEKRDDWSRQVNSYR